MKITSMGGVAPARPPLSLCLTITNQSVESESGREIHEGEENYCHATWHDWVIIVLSSVWPDPSTHTGGQICENTFQIFDKGNKLISRRYQLHLILEQHNILKILRMRTAIQQKEEEKIKDPARVIKTL
jgi:hypothetical protein